MKKSDLKTGMLVQLRNQKVGLIINNCIITKDSYLSLNDINENLTYVGPSCIALDIIKVSKDLSKTALIPEEWNTTILNSNLKWEESIETIEIGGVKYSKQEVEDKLKNLKPIE